MSNISASSVKDLRERTGAGMMDCKKALTETNGDFEAALDWLRAKGLSAAAKKAGRVASEGLVAAIIDDKVGAAIELNSETDFVARNDIFQTLISNIAKLSLRVDDLEALKAAKMPSGKNVSDEIVEHVATIGENLSLRRMEKLFVNEGVVAHYVHNAIVDNLGKIAVIVALESKGDKTKLLELRQTNSNAYSSYKTCIFRC
jgi:elongation factor Ts